jgi:hypothetical protein
MRRVGNIHDVGEKIRKDGIIKTGPHPDRLGQVKMNFFLGLRQFDKIHH